MVAVRGVLLLAVRAFAAIGRPWGGDWTTPKDLQHFSATGGGH